MIQLCSESILKKICKHEVIGNSQKAFELEQNLRRILINETSEEITNIFRDCFKTLEGYFKDNVERIVKELEGNLSDTQTISQRNNFQTSIFHNLSNNMIMSNGKSTTQGRKSNSRNIRLLMDSKTASNHQSLSAC